MSDDVLIKVDHVSKKFCRSLKRSLWYGVKDMCAELSGRSDRDRLSLQKDEFLAVNDVSFSVRRGECLGLLGANGAGKSTLLKMINGLIKPDAGRIEMRGRVGALIELGTGFNPILTGRENVYVNAAIHGISKSEVDRRFDEIVEFSEIGDFIDAPFQTYSSGMKVRLGFAVAAQMQPDIFIVDEVLAVGDVGFRWKCYEVIDQLMASSAVIFVSHNMEAITRISTRGIVLESGSITFEGDPIAASQEYLAHFGQKTEELVKEDHVFDYMRLDGSEQNKTIDFGDDLEVSIGVTSPKSYDDLLLKINITTASGQIAAEYSSRNNGDRIDLKPGKNQLQAKLLNLNLLPQKYSVSFTLIHNRCNTVFWCRNVRELTVEGTQQGHQPYQLVT